MLFYGLHRFRDGYLAFFPANVLSTCLDTYLLFPILSKYLDYFYYQLVTLLEVREWGVRKTFWPKGTNTHTATRSGEGNNPASNSGKERVVHIHIAFLVERKLFWKSHHQLPSCLLRRSNAVCCQWKVVILNDIFFTNSNRM